MFTNDGSELIRRRMGSHLSIIPANAHCHAIPNMFILHPPRDIVTATYLYDVREATHGELKPLRMT